MVLWGTLLPSFLSNSSVVLLTYPFLPVDPRIFNWGDNFLKVSNGLSCPYFYPSGCSPLEFFITGLFLSLLNSALNRIWSVHVLDVLVVLRRIIFCISSLFAVVALRYCLYPLMEFFAPWNAHPLISQKVLFETSKMLVHLWNFDEADIPTLGLPEMLSLPLSRAYLRYRSAHGLYHDTDTLACLCRSLETFSRWSFQGLTSSSRSY